MKKSIRERARELLLSRASGREIALGFAVGVFFSFSPLYGLQMLLCLIVVLIFRRLNKLAVFLGVQLSWFYPPMLYLDYLAGRHIMPGVCPELDFDYFKRGVVRAGVMAKELILALLSADFTGVDKPEFIKLWDFIIRLFPVLFVGSLVVGGISAVAAYLIAIRLIRRYRGRGKA
jgi:uncharacterized protein (DUF2062 family)